MRRLHFWTFCFFLLAGTCGLSQGKGKEKSTEIELIHADKLTVDKSTPKGASKLKGNVQLQHQKAQMFCDSALLFDNNSVKAYGHVKIIEGDSLTLLGDSLFYDGNTRVAKVRGKVKVDNKASVLTTSFLDYDRDAQVGHYYRGGVIDSRKEKVHLTSDIGYYYSAAKRFHYKRNVVMTHPDYVIKTDTMQYAPEMEKTWFFGPTWITSEDRTIYCEYGWFDQLKDQARFIHKARIETTSQILKGDTIEYDQAQKIGISKCNVSMIDTAEKFEVIGDFARYEEIDSTTFVTRNMMLMQDMEGDTFYLTADTLFSYPDTAGKRIIKTYHDTRFYKSDMQGACDSLLYLTKDSIIYMYNDPILWSDDNQITADSIHMTLKHGVIHRMHMNQNAFIISHEDSVYYNQIKGRRMLGYFKDEALHKVDVFQDGETIYYPREDDGSMIGVNETSCKNMTIRIDSNTIQKITFYDQPVAKLTPSDDMPAGGLLLEGFQYRVDERPASAQDLLFRQNAGIVPKE
jgi:lipopolysaccharide export system protein LptA